MPDLPDYPSVTNWHFLGWPRCSCGVHYPPEDLVCGNPDCERREFLLKEMAVHANRLPPVDFLAVNDFHIFPEEWLDVCRVGRERLKAELEDGDNG